MKKVVVIGGGIAGMEGSTYLKSMGYDVTLIEKNSQLGGHLLKWEKLFPTMRLGKDVVNFLNDGIKISDVNVLLNTEVVKAEKNGNEYIIELNNGQKLNADAVLVATGYDTFNASQKEEYGYGVYDNVITSAELEELFTSGKTLTTPSGKVPKRIGFVHCVGSRDEKVGNIYCSKVCCVTAVKQSIEIKEKLPDVEVYCFYMDLRMFGMHFEALYREAQEKWGINFIRGRLSEACENIDHSLVVKVEDTLAGKPLKMNVDLLVLMVGIVPSQGTKDIGRIFGLEFGVNGFLKSLDQHMANSNSNVPGIFYAGTCVAPRPINNTFVDARSAAVMVASYLENYKVEGRINTINN
ncbi:MAG: FAD-dependent oxidoreductase [Bacteroidales bacterium]|nr:FAD-dependent oxidoreductase [Bacteroidales bacterium]